MTKRNNGGGVPFTPEEDDAIRKLYGSKTVNGNPMRVKDIARKLGRKEASVSTRITDLGLRRPADDCVESRIGTIVRPRAGVLIHYAKPAYHR